MIQFIIHTWFKGHSVETYRYLTTLASNSGAKGWLMKCECGRTWVR